MRASGKKPTLTVVAGTDAPTEGPQSSATGKPKYQRKAKGRASSAATREVKAIELSKTLEAILPAYVELHRAWAVGATRAHAFCDANFTQEERRGAGPAWTALQSIYKSSGADLGQAGMIAIYSEISSLARAIERAPATTLEGMRAKALVAIFECIPTGAAHSGFDFEDGPPAYGMLFRACLSVTGLSKLATQLEGRLQSEEN